jgi:nucleoid-associated protein YgaU
MQPIERYGLISFLFIVVSALAVYLWDAEPVPEEAGGETVARGNEPSSAARGKRDDEGARRANNGAEPRVDPRVDLRAERPGNKPAPNAGAPQGPGITLPVGGAERGDALGGRASQAAPQPEPNRGLNGTPRTNLHPGVTEAQPPRPGGSGARTEPTKVGELPDFQKLAESVGSMTSEEVAALRDKNRAQVESPRVDSQDSATLSGPIRPTRDAGRGAQQEPRAKLVAQDADTDTIWTVAPGETLGDIALKHYGSARYWDEILAANPGVSELRLQVNQKLKLPALDTAPAQSTASASNASTQPAAPRTLANDEVEVASGDTLSEIAQRHLGKASRWPEIAALNPRANVNALQVGMVLKLPQSAARLDVDSSKLVAADDSSKAQPSYGRVR